MSRAEHGLWHSRVTVTDLDCHGRPVAVYHGRNLLMHGGASLLWQAAIGRATTTAGQALTVLDAANSAIGAGTGSAAVAATQTNLQGATRLRKTTDPGFPEHTDGVVAAAATITFQTTFAPNEANFTWQEIGLFNSASDGQGRMVNRLLLAAGAKSSTISRVVSIAVTLS